MAQPLRVLIVEDSEDDAALILEELERGGYALIPKRVETRKDMTLALAREGWDIVIADYNMPRFNGVEALKLVKEINADLPFIVVSGSIGEEVAVALMKAGANDYVMKGNLARLAPGVDRELRKSQKKQKLREAEEALKHSEKKYSTLVEHNNDGVLIIRDGMIVFANRRMSEMTGFPPETALGKSFIDFVSPGYRSAVADAYRKRMSGQKAPDRYETKILSRGGKEIDVEVAASIIEFEGKPADMAIVRDITERKRAEKTIEYRLELEKTIAAISSRFVGVGGISGAINTSLGDLGKFAKASRAYLFLSNPDSTTMDNTHEWCADGVSPRTDNLKTLPCDVFPWWMDKLHKNEAICIRDVAKMPEEAKAEREILGSQGVKSLVVQPVYVRGRLSGFVGLHNVECTGEWSDDNKTIMRMAAEVMGSALERKQTEEELRLSEQNFRNSQDKSPLGVRVVNAKWDTLYANQAALNIFGFNSLEDMKKISVINELYTRESYAEHRSRMEKVRWGEQVPNSYEISIKRKDGELRHLQLSCQRVLWDGTPKIQFLYQDITKRKQSEKALKQTIEEIEAFAYTAAHDLKAPLVTIQGFANALKQDLQHNRTDRVEEDVRLIDTGISKMMHLLKTILEYGRTSRLPPPTEKLPFGEIVEEALAQVEGNISSSSARVSVAPSFPDVIADRVSMVRALNNLIVNATQYRDETRPLAIDIGYHTSDDEVIFYIRDNGSGISPGEQEKVFEAFYRGSNASEGTGLGLKIVKRVIERHGGRVWLESEPGKGTTVCFTLANSDLSRGQ